MPQKHPPVDIVGVGLNATDTVVHLREFPARGSKAEYETSTTMLGGQVASAMAACQSWGLSTRYVGKLGKDEAASLHAAEFARLGVEAQLVYADAGASPRSLVLVEDDGERTVLCQRDPRLRLQPKELRQEWITDARMLLIDGFDTDAAIQSARWARGAGVPVIADVDEIYDGIDELLSLVDYLVVSRDFPARLTGIDDTGLALRELQRRYGNRLSAATLGPGGVLAWDGNRMASASAFRVPVADSTGAGDVFHAGMIYGLLQKLSLEQTLEFACAAAAINCMQPGARGGIGPVGEVHHLVRTGDRYGAPAI